MNLRTPYISTWDCDTPDTTKVDKGTTIEFPCVWAHGKDIMTDDIDIVFDTETEMTLAEILVEIERRATNWVQSQGADQIRQYYIESIYENEKGVLVFNWGT